MTALSERDFLGLCVQAGLELDQQTLDEYFEIYRSYIEPMLRRLERGSPIETRFSIHHVTNE
jgi:hypothetical protein